MKILHLYHDIMNLYGDYANVSALCRILEKSGEEVQLDRLSLNDEAQLADYDFIYIGSGTERNQKTVLADFMKYREALRDYIVSDRFLLMTGNSFEMLGKSITDGDGNVHEGLGLYAFTATEERGLRYTTDSICTADFLSRPLVGFINKSSWIKGITQPLFHTELGIGDNCVDETEGIRDRNFFGTHLTGPILMKNPHMLVYIASNLLGREPETAHLAYEQKGYETTLRKLSERMQG